MKSQLQSVSYNPSKKFELGELVGDRSSDGYHMAACPAGLGFPS
ncbi:MAG: hypothetical protein ACFB0E_13805 [Leptolyngbyaceae cyanobacterium]